ncbi:hypothetical protein GOP47_0027924 [Adiantum capillus-veneris]|nr:hypothetical protein GOP47_0027924 [Adiantum capillus-veneris]
MRIESKTRNWEQRSVLQVEQLLEFKEVHLPITILVHPGNHLHASVQLAALREAQRAEHTLQLAWRDEAIAILVEHVESSEEVLVHVSNDRPCGVLRSAAADGVEEQTELVLVDVAIAFNGGKEGLNRVFGLGGYPQAAEDSRDFLGADAPVAVSVKGAEHTREDVVSLKMIPLIIERRKRAMRSGGREKSYACSGQ